MRHCLPTLAVLAAVLTGAPLSQAQSPDMAGESRDMVRALRNADGTRSVYKRQAGWRGMRCATYTAGGKLAAILDYTEGKHGELMGCIVYDSNRKPIYKVSYGYDSKARLVEERMFSHPGRQLVQRVIYRYDAAGNRAKPLIISLSTSGAAIAPTMETDANKIHRELGRGQRR